MSIIGKYTADTTEDDDNKESQGFTLPVVIRKKQEDSLKRDITISAILHPAILGAIYLISVILLFFGISLSIFDRPKPKMKDIEFVLVEKEGTPINKNTPYRSDINSRAGGHHDPTKKVSMPSPAPAAVQKPSPAPQPPAKTQQQTPKQSQPAPKPKPQPAKKPAVTQQIQQALQPKPAPQPEPEPAPQPVEKAAEPEPERAKPSAAKASFEEEDGMIDFTSALSDEMEDTTSFAVASAQNAPAPREPAPAASRQRAYSPFGANSIESKFGPLKFGEGFDVERDSDPRTGLFSRKKHRDR